MKDWIPFNEGEYWVERAFLFAPDDSAVLLEAAVIAVYQGPGGRRKMSGRCRIQNILLVDLLDEHDKIDLALDLGEEFKYILRDPDLKSGKVFSPDVKSTLQFSPQKPWEQVSRREFETLYARMKFLIP